MNCHWAQRAALVVILILAGSTNASAQNRTPVPDVAAQTKARELAREVYGEDYQVAKTSRQRLALVKKMLDEAASIEGDAAGHFVVLQIAGDMAAGTGDVAVALEVVERIVRTFDVDPLQARVDCLEAVAKAAKQSSQHRSIARQALSLLDMALAGNDAEAASRLGEIARESAGRAREPGLVKQVAARLEAVKELEEAHAEYQKALSRVKDNPFDPEANLVVGRYLCFTEGDWDKGLPMLVRCADPELMALAEQELLATDAPGDQADLGHVWWDLAEKEKKDTTRDSFRARAAHWYARALPSLTGLDKMKVEARMDDLGDSASPKANGQPGKPAAEKDRQIAEAVSAGLEWFASRQRQDGSWTFAAGPDPGTLTECPGAATAMALLPFLRAGHTHQDGLYKEAVSGGLTYLGRSMKASPAGMSLTETGATMYGHALATMVLCEAYLRTKDRRLRDPAQSAVTFIVYAQDPKGGGWRYSPRSGGDTSVTGWQITALQTAKRAGLQVPPATFVGVDYFLNSVQASGGASYGYTSPGKGQATTAIGLLGRLHLGWKKDTPALREGAEWISQTGPSPSNIYYNYYATQLMRTYGDEFWDTWKPAMRKLLLNSQRKAGESTGWWPAAGGHTGQGGCLYATAMAIMILQLCAE